jgi:tetratricopeptide (TPR) repeat protein
MELMRVLLGFVLLVSALWAEQVDYKARGWDHFYNLEFEEAYADFSKAAAERPTDINAHVRVAQAIMFRILFRAGALESELVTGNNPFLRSIKAEPTPDEQRQFLQQIDVVLKMATDRLAENPKDTEALYSQGVAYSMRANYAFIVRKAHFDALKDATNARKSHDRALEVDPSMVDAKLLQGVHEYIVGCLPFHYRVLGFLTGFRGDKDDGKRILQLVAQKGKDDRFDAEVFLAAIYRRERRPQDAIPLLNDMIRRFPRNYLFRFELSQMYADAIEEDKAMAVLQEIEDLKKKGSPGFQKLPYERILFSRGVIQFWYRHFIDAAENLRHVTAKASELDLNTATTAWLRLGQTYDMLGQRNKALQAYQAGIELAPRSEQARECRSYLGSPYRRKLG